jgi:hypothetical protein
MPNYARVILLNDTLSLPRAALLSFTLSRIGSEFTFTLHRALGKKEEEEKEKEEEATKRVKSKKAKVKAIILLERK